MTDYTLNIAFTSVDLKTIHEVGEQVVILRGSTAGLQVVWLAFAPFQTNLVQWTDDFSLYASPTPVAPGNVITPVAQVASAAPRSLYPFVGGQFAPAESAPGLGPRQCEVLNDPTSGGMLTFGPAQSPRVNGVVVASPCPVLAQPVPSGQAGFFELTSELTILLRSATSTALVINYVPVRPARALRTSAAVVQSAAITLAFTAASAAQSIAYDGTTGTFRKSAPLAPIGPGRASARRGRRRSAC